MGDDTCSFSGCQRKIRSLGLCWSHRRQQAQGRELTPIRAWRSQTMRDDQGRKQCQVCNEWLPETAYAGSGRNADGLANLCRSCATDAHRMHYYGITAARYDEMLRKQGGGCAICGEQCSTGRRLAVDHDHACCPGDKTCGKCVRGLLCGECNQGIGKLKDSPRLLIAAIDYLT